MLELNAVHAHYGKVHVLQGTSLKVQSGEAVGLLGRNGVGKTTTLKTIMGLVKATGGEIVFDGHSLTDIAPHSIPGTGIGYVPQGRGIFPSLSVKENLEIGLTKAPPSQVFDYVFDRFPRLKERLSQPGGTLSGGEQQMLAISRALARDVKLLLLDEPYEGLAPVIVQEIERTLEEIKSHGMTTIIVEQNAIAALHLADRAIILDMGKVVFDGLAQEVLENAEMRQQYLAI